jgi:large subunit ribosomal protein L19
MDFRKIIESKQPKKVFSDFKQGDTVKVYLKIVEGDKERIQVFEGIVIARDNSGIQEAFTVRRVSYGVGVERKFFTCSPSLEKIESVKKGMVKRAKLYYLRGKSRKEGRIKEKLEEELMSKEVIPEVKAEAIPDDKMSADVPAEAKTEVKKKEKKESKKETKRIAKKEKAATEKKAKKA